MGTAATVLIQTFKCLKQIAPVYIFSDSIFTYSTHSRIINSARIRESILKKILVNKTVRMDSHKYFDSSYKVIWQKLMDSCKIPLGESKWILTLGREFMTLDLHPYSDHIQPLQLGSAPQVCTSFYQTISSEFLVQGNHTQFSQDH